MLILARKLRVPECRLLELALQVTRNFENLRGH